MQLASGHCRDLSTKINAARPTRTGKRPGICYSVSRCLLRGQTPAMAHSGRQTPDSGRREIPVHAQREDMLARCNIMLGAIRV